MVTDHHGSQIVFKTDFASPFCSGIHRLIKNARRVTLFGCLTFSQYMPEGDFACL